MRDHIPDSYRDSILYYHEVAEEREMENEEDDEDCWNDEGNYSDNEQEG